MADEIRTAGQSGNITVPANVYAYAIELMAGGAGGSNGFLDGITPTGGDGGGAGSSFSSADVACTPGASLAYSVGNGGAANNAGGNTSLAANTVIGGTVSSGGNGGVAQGGAGANSTGTYGASGGNGGTALSLATVGGNYGAGGGGGFGVLGFGAAASGGPGYLALTWADAVVPGSSNSQSGPTLIQLYAAVKQMRRQRR